jgi:two-component system chemotaxis response regulator CheB
LIKVLVVDDSAVVREFLVHVLGSDPALKVVGTARDGEEALKVVAAQKPDVVTMDISMPKMNGLEATRLIMERHPTPIVIVSGSLGAEEEASFRAVEAGALAVLQRPTGVGHPDHEATVGELVRTVKLMSEVKVVKRWPRPGPTETGYPVPGLVKAEVKGALRQIKLVAIGASTGGPVVLQRILAGLPKNYPAPVLIVQHIAAGFVHGFADWLAQSSGFAIEVATHGARLLPGRAYVAPDGFHMEVAGGGDRIALMKGEPEGGLRPSVDALFRSVARVYGPAAVGVLLTGMGKDGARELGRMKERGAVTVAQDEESSIIHGMPGEAISLNAATHILSPEGIATLLTKLTADGSGDAGNGWRAR